MRDKLWDKRSDTNEAVEPESKRALASAAEPSGAWTMTRQVISMDLDEGPAAALDDMDSEEDRKNVDSYHSASHDRCEVMCDEASDISCICETIYILSRNARV